MVIDLRDGSGDASMAALYKEYRDGMAKSAARQRREKGILRSNSPLQSFSATEGIVMRKYVQSVIEVKDIRIRRLPHLHSHVKNPSAWLDEISNLELGLHTGKKFETAQTAGWCSTFHHWDQVVEREMRCRNAQG